MNGNRGAKGSIKDRLISMLYRMRYKNKELKEDEYSIKNKEKKVDYLNNLKDFQEQENIDILDDIDKNLLDKIKYNVNFKVTRKGISDDVILELDSIERKNSDLDEKVDLKKEIKKTKNEVVILKEVEDFIKKSLGNINDIKFEIEIIKKEAKEKNNSTEKLELKYKELKQKINKLKLQYDTIKDKYDLSEFKIVESIKLIDNIDDYKSVARLNEMEMLLNVCKKEINKISGITIISEESKKIGSNIENIKEDQKQIKIKFKIDKENINKLDNIKKNIEEELKYQQETINDMYKKASYYEKQINKEIYCIGHRNILGSILRIAGGILTLPLSGKSLFGIAFGNSMINKGLKEMNRELETKERIVINYKYEDISKKIEEVDNKLEYINLVLSDSLNEIKKLKNNFNDKFQNYDKVLPEYKEMLEKVNSLEENLINQQVKINNMNDKLKEETVLNKQKLKKIGK